MNRREGTQRVAEKMNLNGNGMSTLYDALFVVSFGGPEGMDDVMPFLEKVVRGRLIPQDRLLEVARHYRIMACGASVGRNYGPIIVAREPIAPEALAGKRVAIPGALTTAYLLLRIYVPDTLPRVIPFDEIMDAVAQGDVDAGVIIHEGQITYESKGFAKVLDLGEAWFQDTGLPIPLGLDMVNRNLGEAEAHRLNDIFLSSIRYAREHASEANAYALSYSRGLDPELSRRFVGMYVNEDTLQMGQEGRRALEALYQRAHERGLIQAVPPLDIVGLE